MKFKQYVIPNIIAGRFGEIYSIFLILKFQAVFCLNILKNDKKFEQSHQCVKLSLSVLDVKFGVYSGQILR